jgi:hypothetical protein
MKGITPIMIRRKSCLKLLAINFIFESRVSLLNIPQSKGIKMQMMSVGRVSVIHPTQKPIIAADLYDGESCHFLV